MCRGLMAPEQKAVQALGDMCAVKYTENNIWAEEENEEAVIGVTEFALEELGKIIFIDPPSVGDELTRDETIFVVEGEENTIEFLSPLDGVVIDINPAASQSLEDIEDDPTNHGWILRIEMDDPSQIDEMLEEKDYAKLNR